MPDKIPVTELARRFCIATHRSDLTPGPTAGVPCAEHSQLAKNYYGLLDPKYKALVKVIWNEAIGSPDDGE